MHDCLLGTVRPKTNAEFWVQKRTQTVERDAKKVAQLRALGWRVRVVWECKIENGTFTVGLRQWIRAGAG
jgi:DNA mismatch endonuclease (patch repair protein)